MGHATFLGANDKYNPVSDGCACKSKTNGSHSQWREDAALYQHPPHSTLGGKAPTGEFRGHAQGA